MNSLKESLNYRIKKSDLLLKGIGVSPGIIIGKVFVVDPSEIELSAIQLNTDAEIKQEIGRFKQALSESKQQLLNVKKEVERKKRKETSYIIDAQIFILEDKLLIENITTAIKEKKIDAASAVKDTIHGLSNIFNDLGDAYLKERKTDFDYIGERTFSQPAQTSLYNLWCLGLFDLLLLFLLLMAIVPSPKFGALVIHGKHLPLIHHTLFPHYNADFDLFS